MTSEIEQLIPDYELLAKVGEGAYGEVYLAKSITGQYRAIKILYRDRLGSAEAFDREFRGTQFYEEVSRRHEALIDILHVGRNDESGFFYYVMEAADDERRGRTFDPATYRPRTLRYELATRTALSVKECIAIGVRLASALTFLQEHGLVHRDVKPSNVVFVDGRLKLADIGLVVDVREAKSLVGTPGYEPPEHHGSYAGDVYSLGKLLYEISSGRDSRHFGEAPTDEADTDDPRFSKLNKVVMCACADHYKDRYQSAKALLKALEGIDRSDSATTPSRARRFSAIPKLLRVLILSVIFLLLAMQVRDGCHRRRMVKETVDSVAGSMSALKDELSGLQEDLDNLEPSTVDTIRPVVSSPTAAGKAPIEESKSSLSVRATPPEDKRSRVINDTADERPARIATAARAQMNKEAQSRQVLRDAFSPFPETGIAVSISQPKLIRTIDAAGAEIGVTVDYSLTQDFLDAARQAALQVSTRQDRLRSLDSVVPDPTEPGVFNRTGIAFVGSATLDFYHLRPEHYWTMVAAILTGGDWLLPAPFNVYQFPKKGTYEHPFQVTMPRLEVEFVDSQGRVYHYEDCEVFGDSVFLNEKRRFAYRGISQANDHRLLQFAQGLVTFVYFRTGVQEERRLDLGKATPSVQEVMLLPPSGYEPEVDSYSNGKFAMVLQTDETRQREYQFTVTLDQLEKLHRLQGRVVSPLKNLVQQ